MANHKTQRKRLASAVGAVFATSLCLSSASADDTEVFFGQVDPDLDIFPNVLFVLDTSGSMRRTDNTGSTRLERMKDALDTILDNTANVNVGVMRFNGSYGGGSVLFPVTPIDQEICKQSNCGNQSSAPQVGSGANDVEERDDTGAVDSDGNVLNMGFVNNSNRSIGVRFDSLNIPQGAKIVSAFIEFTSDNDRNSDANFTIRGHKLDHSPIFTEVQNDVTARPLTGAIVNWNNIQDWKQGLVYPTDDFSDVLQEIVDQDAWCGGNAASFMIQGSGQRDARSFEQSASDAPKLKFTYDASNIPSGGGCVNKTVVANISAGTDDAEQSTYYGRTITGSSDLEMPYDRGNEQIVGLRFSDIQIPKNALITDASLEFEVDRPHTGDLSLKVSGEAHDDPPTYRSTWRNISNRAKTSSVIWSNVDAAATNSKIIAPGLAPIVQEIVNRGGWQSGNAMAFMVEKVSGNNMRELESYNGEPANPPKLRINYRATSDRSDPSLITARDKLKEVVAGLTATGGTPIVDAYYEAAKYFRGENVDYGTKRGTYKNKYHRVSVPESYSGGSVYRPSGCTDQDLDQSDCKYERIDGNAQYISPFKSSCQTNHIVFLSDGAATSNSAVSKVKSLIGMDAGTACINRDGDEHCGEELAAWLNESDHASGITGTQNISTYTIGFNFSSNFLEDIAQAGGGSYFQASSAEQLVNVFQSILGDVLSVDTSFVAPGATVNQFNRLTHRSDIYFALFKPDQRPTWTGNLKRYQITEKNGEIAIVDATNEPAIDTTTGFFKDTSQSHWLEDVATQGVDGNQVAKGGAAMKLEFDTKARNIYTYVGDYPLPSGGVSLTQNAQALHENNANITVDTLGIANKGNSDAERQGYRNDLLKWARGIDVKDDDDDNDTTDWRQHMGDPMHARPVIINYAAAPEAETLVFVGTNEGFLHAFENINGTEKFAFVPKDVMPNFDTFWNNQAGDSHPYGLDGSLSIWTNDINENVTVDPGEKAFLYTGMRRGGDKYYAFDVSDQNNPKLAWVIDGSTPGFGELGQTWSKMTPSKIRFKGEERDVLIFTAGYDDNQDYTLDTNRNRVPRTEDTKGRGLFIVDAEFGTLLYSALPNGTSQAVGDVSRFNDLNYSMPANLKVIDVDLDGFSDQIYASDTGGQVWRFDLTPHHQSGELLKGGVIADLGGSGNNDERRFYYEPDVAMISNNGDRFLSVSIGSGWRAHPLDLSTDDRFYMIKMRNLFAAPPGYGKSTDGGTTYEPITEADLVDITGLDDPPTNEFGWLYDLGATGEKVLGASVTADSNVIFSSYRPALAVGACTTAIGGGSVYTLKIIDGSPAIDNNGDGELTVEDVEVELAHGGIPPEPALLITENGPIILAGPEQIPADIEDLTHRTFWVDQATIDDQ